MRYLLSVLSFLVVGFLAACGGTDIDREQSERMAAAERVRPLLCEEGCGSNYNGWESFAMDWGTEFDATGDFKEANAHEFTGGLAPGGNVQQTDMTPDAGKTTQVNVAIASDPSWPSARNVIAVDVPNQQVVQWIYKGTTIMETKIMSFTSLQKVWTGTQWNYKVRFFRPNMAD